MSLPSLVSSRWHLGFGFSICEEKEKREKISYRWVEDTEKYNTLETKMLSIITID